MKNMSVDHYSNLIRNIGSLRCTSEKERLPKLLVHTPTTPTNYLGGAVRERKKKIKKVHFWKNSTKAQSMATYFPTKNTHSMTVVSFH
jgi:hypothetical protein